MTTAAREFKYTPIGNHSRMFRCRDRVVVFEGPAGTGKTRADLEKAHTVAENCPNSRQLFVRRVKQSIRNTVLDTFEREVLFPGHPALLGASRRLRDEYEYPNGSVIRIGGLDSVEDADKVMSGEYDRIIVFEATDLRDPDPVLKLMTRLRAGKTSYHQLVLECNPGAPSHWINQWANAGRATRIRTTHRDNPRYWDGEGWTAEGREYIVETLGRLSGTLRARLLDGQWVQAEGLVYDTFDQTVHVKPCGWPPVRTIITVDDGYTDPCAILRLDIDHDGRVHATDEVYKPGLSVSAKIDAVRAMGGESATIIYDAAAAVIGAELRQHFADVIACDKRTPIVEGCHLVRERLKDPGDGRPRLMIDGGCANLIREFEAYEWSKRRDGSGKDAPIDQYNHALDALRYAVVHLDAHAAPPLVVTGADVVDDEDMWRAM